MLIFRLQNKASDKQYTGIISNFYTRVNEDEKKGAAAWEPPAHTSHDVLKGIIIMTFFLTPIAK